MTEHNHRRPMRRRGPKVKMEVETIERVPGMKYGFGRHCNVVSDADGIITYEHVVPDGHVKRSLPTRHWRPPENIARHASDVGLLSDVCISAGSGCEHSNGHRGQARAVRGAKKFVRTRIRFHENAATRKLALETDSEDL